MIVVVPVFTKGHHDEFYVSGQQLANNITDQYNKLSLCICKSTAITTIKCIEMTLVVTNKHFYFSTLFTTDSTRLSDLHVLIQVLHLHLATCQQKYFKDSVEPWCFAHQYRSFDLL